MKKVTFCKFKPSLRRNFVQFTNFLRILSSAFLRFCSKFSLKIIFYLPVNTDKPTEFKKYRLLGICLCDCFKFCLPKMSRRETPSWLRSQNSADSQGYSELREPIKTREKCLVNTKSNYIGKSPRRDEVSASTVTFLRIVSQNAPDYILINGENNFSNGDLSRTKEDLDDPISKML